MNLDQQVNAVRHSVAYSRLEHVVLLRVGGTRAYDVLDHVIAGSLRIRDGQLSHTLLLTSEGFPFADAYVARDDEQFLLLAEGPAGEQLEAHIRDAVPPGSDVSIENCSGERVILALDGPFAWELVGAAVDPEVIGLPYLTFYHHGGMTCYRAGKTGEYGYGLIVAHEQASALEERILELGSAFDVEQITLEARDLCALENSFFNIRREGRERVTPIELQLQWRVSYRKNFVGAEALRNRRADGARERLTCLVTSSPVATGEAITVEGETIGRVVNSGFSEARGEWIALALLDVGWAYPGLDAFAVGAEASRSARSVSPPVLLNRSLSVSPQLHSYATRDQYAVPALSRS